MGEVSKRRRKGDGGNELKEKVEVLRKREEIGRKTEGGENIK